MEKRVIIAFFSNGTEEDWEAIKLLMAAGIPFVNYGPTSEEKTPLLHYGLSWKYQGLSAIKDFIEKWKTNNLPSLDLFKARKAPNAG